MGGDIEIIGAGAFTFLRRIHTVEARINAQSFHILNHGIGDAVKGRRAVEYL